MIALIDEEMKLAGRWNWNFGNRRICKYTELGAVHAVMRLVRIPAPAGGITDGFQMISSKSVETSKGTGCQKELVEQLIYLIDRQRLILAACKKKGGKLFDAVSYSFHPTQVPVSKEL